MHGSAVHPNILCSLYHALGVSALDRTSTRPILNVIQERLGMKLIDWVQNQNKLVNLLETQDQTDPEQLTSDHQVSKTEPEIEDALSEIFDEVHGRQSQKVEPNERDSQNIRTKASSSKHRSGKWEGDDVDDWWDE